MKENQASITAFTVLQGMLYIGKATPHSYLVDGEIVKIGNQILADSDEGKKRLKQLNSPLTKLSVNVREYLLLPGITLHYILRKRYIEDQTRKAIADGATQIVNLGAGFDTLCWRLSKEHPEVNFIEIDHPDTHKLKTRALAAASADLTNMHFLAVDFNHQDLNTALGEFIKFDQSRQTLYICEGVMMYLTEEEIGYMFATIKNLTGSGSQLLFTALEPQGSPRNNTRKLLYLFLSLISEPLKWELDSDNIPVFLAQYSCHMTAKAGTNVLKESYLKPEIPATLHYGEYLVMAKFD